MKTIILLVTLFYAITVLAAGDNDCTGAPDDAVLSFDAPYGTWFNIECNAVRKAHFITSAPGYKWEELNTGKPYAFHAYGPISPDTSVVDKNIYEPHKYYFKKYKVSSMTPQQATRLSRFLPSNSKSYKNIDQLDVLTSTNVVYSFFIYLQENTPEWLLVCANYNCQKAVVIKVDD